MDHPSMYNPFDEDDDDPELPDGVTREQVEQKVKDLLDVLEKIGMYTDDGVGIDITPDGRFALFLMCNVRDVAFTQRVQNPEQDAVNQTFHQFEANEVRDRFQQIKDKFSGNPDEDPPSS